MNREQKYQMNGSSVHSSRSSSPELEPVGDLPQVQAQILEQQEERVPTPFPNVQPPTDQPMDDFVVVPLECPLPPLPLAMPIASRSLSPIRHPFVNQQLSNISGSSSDPPIPLTPTVHVINPFPFALSGSSSAASFEAVGHLIRRLREDRRMNEESRSRSIASGLYEFSTMILPSLPEYEAPIYHDFGEEELKRRRRREVMRFFYCMCVATGLIGSAVVGQQLGNVIFKWHLR